MVSSDVDNSKSSMAFTVVKTHEDHSENSAMTCLSKTSTQSTSPVPPSSIQHEILRLKARRRTASLAEKPSDIEVHLQDHPPVHSLLNKARDTESSPKATSIHIHAASATMSWKGEDRHCIRFTPNDESSNELLAFCGVFDGHDGPDAAEYCARGLLSHVMHETQDKVDTCRRSKSWRRLSHRFSRSRRSGWHDTDRTDNALSAPEARQSVLMAWKDRLQSGYTQAFEAAQDQFVLNGNPPGETAMENMPLEQAPVKHAHPLSPRIRRLAAKVLGNKNTHEGKNARQGGTTACTLSIYNGHEDEGLGLAEPFATVANCGDSRLFVDHGSVQRSSDRTTDGRVDTNLPDEYGFQQVTRDHRIVNDAEDDEVVRLTAAKAVMNNNRIYPGGLAVSRTIGDAAYASAVIPTPDVFVLDLMPPPESPMESISAEQRQDETSELVLSTTTHRFILASDGLWDSLQFLVHGHKKSQTCVASKAVQGVLGDLASRANAKHPKTAALNLIRRSVDTVGCFDDITVLVVDVTVESS